MRPSFVPGTHNTGLSSTKVKEFLTSGYTNWNSVTGITKYYTSNSSGADLRVVGTTRSDADNNRVPGDVMAFTYIEPGNKTVDYTATSPNGSVTISKTAGGGVFVYIWGPVSSTYSDVKWRKIFVHEIGHIFGYDGHYNANGVMKEYIDYITTSYPTLDNRNHLDQLY